MRTFSPKYPELLCSARVTINALVESEGARAAYIGGSLTAGLGSSLSDVDAFLLVDNHNEPSTRQFYANGRRVDLRYLNVKSLETLISQCASFHATSQDLGTLEQIGRSELTTVVRFMLADIIADDGILESLQNQAEAHIDKIVQAILGALSLEVQNMSEDVRGFLEVGDLKAAKWVAQHACLVAADALLATQGDLYLGEKWVWSRWRRVFNEDFYTPVDLGASDRAAIQESIANCQDILIRAATGQDYEQISVVPVGALKRPSEQSVVLIGRGALVYLGNSHAAQVSPEGLLLLGIAHGRDFHEAIHLTHRLLSIRGTRVTLDEVSAYLEELIEIGAVSTKN